MSCRTVKTNRIIRCIYFKLLSYFPPCWTEAPNEKTPDGRELYHPEDPLYPGISPKNLRTDVGYSEWQSIWRNLNNFIQRNEITCQENQGSQKVPYFGENSDFWVFGIVTGNKQSVNFLWKLQKNFVMILSILIVDFFHKRDMIMSYDGGGNVFCQ